MLSKIKWEIILLHVIQLIFNWTIAHIGIYDDLNIVFCSSYVMLISDK